MAERDDNGLTQRLKRRLLAVDSWIDSAFYVARARFVRAWDSFSDFMGRFRVRGIRRGATELLSEAATLGTVGALALVALAMPAFQATQADWRTQGEYSVTFLDRYGNEIGRRGIFLDDTVPLSEFPPDLIHALLSTEDRRFYDHFGLDVFGLMRAVMVNAQAGGVVQGGSTLTQQLAKLLFLSNERTLDRKIPEAFLALWLEANLTKNEILELYLNRSYMGAGVFGVTAAAEFYFGKPIQDLTLAESAMLAGLVKAPSRYAPHVNLPAARARANTVLSNLVEAGYMTEGQVAAARRNPATVVTTEEGWAPNYFLDWAFQEVERIAPPGGHTLVVRTTLDPRLQLDAEEAIDSILRQHGEHYEVTQGAMVIQDPTGEVRAMVGGRDYGESQFNRATNALRQPGSAFKPFVYAAALMSGYTPDSIVVDAPITIGNWSPRNYGRSYAGNVSLTYAISQSINTIPVRLTQEMGRQIVMDTAHAMGIRSELYDTPTLPLGVSEVSVLDMASAYATFPNDGIHEDSWGILDIRLPDGTVVYDHALDGPEPRRVLPASVAEDMNRMLSSVVASGTGTRARIPGVSVAGKTGTTQSYRDAWFAGYTGNYVGVVWLGNDNYTTTNTLTGGVLPAMAWQDAMEAAHVGIPLAPLPGVSEGSLEPFLVADDAAEGAVQLAGEMAPLSPAAITVLSDIGITLAGTPLGNDLAAAPQAPIQIPPAPHPEDGIVAALAPEAPIAATPIAAVR